jgi:Cdc6-like AAA superfamily ATPase
MPIKDMSADELSEILGTFLTPSKEISTPERLFGRQRSLTEIDRAFASEGRHVFIYGDRGVGKTSLAVTAAYLHNDSSHAPIYIPCGASTSFSDVVQAVATSTLPVEERIEQSKWSGGLNLGIPNMFSVGGNVARENKHNVPKPSNIIEALDIVRFASRAGAGRRIVVIDEFDRIRRDEDKVLFSELIKNVATLDSNLRFIFCGIGRSIEEILGAHPSSGRYFEPIELEKLHHNFLWDIINQVSGRADVKIPDEIMFRIGIVSDGFPHFVHLIGQCMFWAMHDDLSEVSVCTRAHYESGIRGALQKTEPPLRLAWQRATEKTKNKTQYEEALWALADKAETRRQVADIYERSYKRIMRSRRGTLLDQKTFNSRLLTMRKDTHGGIVVGYGSGYFSFRENVLRGYARLKAEAEGIELTPDPV